MTKSRPEVSHTAALPDKRRGRAAEIWHNLARRLLPPAAGTRATGERLDLVLPRGWPECAEPVYFRRHTRDGQTETGRLTTLDTLRTAAVADVRVWTPAAETVLLTASLPTRSPRKIRQALPYALEDQLLGEPESLHFAYRREADGTLSVAVTARARIRAWLDALAQAGLRPAVLCPAILAVPWSPLSWSAAVGGMELWVRTGPATGFACPFTPQAPPELLTAMLREARQAQKAPEQLIVLKPPAGFDAEAWSQALGIAVRTDPRSIWAVPGDSRPPLNLLQGELAPADQIRQRLRPLRPAAVMLALWLAGTLLFDVAQWWQLRHQYQSHRQEMTALLLEAFPDTRAVLDPARQFERGLEQLAARTSGTPHDLLALLARLAPALGENARVRLRGLRYTERSVTLELTLPDAQTLEMLKQALRARGLQAEILAATPRGAEVEGRMRVQPLAAGAATGSSS